MSRIAWLLPLALASVSALITFWSVRAPGGHLGTMLLAVVFWAATGTVWFAQPVRETVAKLRRPALGAKRSPEPHLSWSLFAPPLLAVLTALAVNAHLVEHVTFQLHRKTLEQLVAEAASTPHRHLSHRRVGVYEVREVSPVPGVGECTKIGLRDTGLNTTGFAYCPAGSPVDDPGTEGTRYRSVDGPWYTFAFIW